MIQRNDRVIPIEVKAEENVRAKSMSEYIKNHPQYNLKGLRISMLGYQDQGWMENIPLFGIGANNKIAYYMEQDVIYGIIAQNEVEMGYVGVKQAAEAVRNGEQSTLPEVEFRVITKETMYEKENERLLFPFGN